MSKFKVLDLFTIGNPNRLVVSGDCTEGSVSNGMSLTIPLNDSLSMEAKIQSVEFVDGKIGQESHLGLILDGLNSNDIEFLLSLNIKDNILEVD